MNKNMKNRYRKFRRGNVWWCQDTLDEHQRIITREKNPERMAFGELEHRIFGLSQQRVFPQSKLHMRFANNESGIAHRNVISSPVPRNFSGLVRHSAFIAADDHVFQSSRASFAMPAPESGGCVRV